MENNYIYVILRKAQDDLEKIFQYISINLGNPSAARKLINAFLEAFDRICIFPFSCPVLENIFVNKKDIRKLFVENYIAFYRVESNKVQIIRIVHSTSDYNNKEI